MLFSFDYNVVAFNHLILSFTIKKYVGMNFFWFSLMAWHSPPIYNDFGSLEYIVAYLDILVLNMRMEWSYVAEMLFNINY